MPSRANAPPDHDELSRKLSWRGEGHANGRPLSVFMDQNNRCNLKCRMCGFSDARVAALRKYDMRFSAEALHDEFGSDFAREADATEMHTTPWGTEQEFVYCYCRLPK